MQLSIHFVVRTRLAHTRNTSNATNHRTQPPPRLPPSNRSSSSHREAVGKRIIECTHVISKNCAPHFHHTQNHHQHTIQHSYADRFRCSIHPRAHAAARLVVAIWCCPKIRIFVGSNHDQNMARPKLSDIESAKVMAWAAFLKKHGCWKPCAGMTTRARQEQQALAREKNESRSKA